MQQLAALRETFRSKKKLRQALNSPVVDASQKVKALQALAKKAGLNALVSNFLALTAQNDRADLILPIIDNFEAIIRQAGGRQRAEVISARALSAAEQKKIQDVLQKKCGTDVELNLKLDPSLLGGLMIKIGSQLFDDSLDSKLRKLNIAMKSG